MMIPHSMAVAALVEPVACWKISMIGYPVGVLRALVMFPMQKRMATRKANAKVELMTIVHIIILGTVLADSRTSSLICIAPSKPVG